MAAFAGTAVLLMDFGVTHWVCCQAPQEREYSEDARATPGGGGGRGRQEGATGEAPGSWGGAELVSPGAPGRCWGPAGEPRRRGREAAGPAAGGLAPPALPRGAVGPGQVMVPRGPFPPVP